MQTRCRDSTEVVLEPDDVVLTAVVPALDLDDDEFLVLFVHDAVSNADRYLNRLTGAGKNDIPVNDG